MKAFGYLRLSKFDEGTTSPQRQREALGKLCQERGWELLQTHEDIDISGWNGKRRPGLERMLDNLDSVDAVVVYRIDRLARSQSEFLRIITVLKDHDVLLAATDMTLDPTPSGDFVRDIIARVAQLESDNLSVRSRAMHAYKRDRGEWVGRPPFGWNVAGKHLERNEDQQAVLRDVARRYIGGESLNSIGKSVGMLPTVLARILYSDRVQEALPDDLSGPLSEAILARRYHQKGPVNLTLLGGIATCAMCGERLSMSSSRGNRKQGRWYTLRCRETGHVTIAGPWLERYVTEQVLDYIDVDKLLASRKRKKTKTRKASAIEARLELLDAQYVEGKVSKARFDKMNGALLAQLQEAQKAERDNGVDLPAELARNLSERWPTFSINTQRRIILAVVESIKVVKATGHGPIDPSRVEIAWRS